MVHSGGMQVESALLFETPVEIWVVEGGNARVLRADSASFSIGPSIEKAPDAAPFAFSVLVPAFVSRDTGAAEALAGRPLDQDASDLDAAEPDDLPGRLLDPRDPEAWASALVRWLSDPIERARFRRLAVDNRTSLNPWSETAAVIARAALG